MVGGIGRRMDEWGTAYMCCGQETRRMVMTTSQSLGGSGLLRRRRVTVRWRDEVVDGIMAWHGMAWDTLSLEPGGEVQVMCKVP